MDAPPREVLAAFGVDGAPRVLTGGEGTSFRVEDIVLKPAVDVSEATWTQALLSTVEADGFTIADPVATGEGRWVHDGWTACRFVPGLRPAAPDWALVIAAGLRFCDAVEGVRDDGEEVLAARTHRWAVADRVAWGETVVALSGEGTELVEEIIEVVDRPRRDRQFVHGDLSGNVFVGEDATPVILDVSPYLRPREWAAAIVVADAVLWHDAPLGVVHDFVDRVGDRDLFARALVFRLVAEQLSGPRHRTVLEPYRRILVALK